MADQKPTLCVVAGPNGSGKTTTTELLLANEWGANSLYINPDNIAEQEFGGWNNPDAVLKASCLSCSIELQMAPLSSNILTTSLSGRKFYCKSY